MKTIKISTLSPDEKVSVGNSILTVGDILHDINFYRNKKIYITKKYIASINAEDMLESALEFEADNMYEDWLDLIRPDIEVEDIEEIQKVLDRILARNPNQNISYTECELIEIDI